MTADAFAALMLDARPTGTGWIAKCPAHDDHTPSLKIDEGDDGTVLVTCFAGCAVEKIVGAVGVKMVDLFPASNGNGTASGRGVVYPSRKTATVQPDRAGCTLAVYAAMKKLPEDKLKELGLSDISYIGRPAVRMPYLDVNGGVAAVRFRLSLVKGADADGRFAWRKGDKACLYGLDRLALARASSEVTLVEGESDNHTLYVAGLPTIALPGANIFKEEWATHFDGIATINVVIEPDKGGEAVLRWLGRSAIRERVRLVRLDGFKDVSEMWIADSVAFIDRWSDATRAAEPWTVFAGRQARERGNAAWVVCRPLAKSPGILALLDESLDRLGVVGERRLARLIYLAATSRFLSRPVSTAVKGPSSCGKSHVVQQVLEHFPPDAYYALSAMSERSIAYSNEPLEHRMLVIYEAAGLSGEIASYLVRSLLSEGHVRYETVEKTKDGLRSRRIDREGPTGLITTTTAIALHHENETRLLSIPATDTADQTRKILLALAENRSERHESDLAPWRALQTWLATAEHRVVVPFAKQLAELISPVATRLRRDFTTLLSLIRAHAILHQVTRERDNDGRILATFADYTAVYSLVRDLYDVAVQATVDETVRETVDAVRALISDSQPVVSGTAVAKKLSLDTSTVSRRLHAAMRDGY